MAKIVFGGLVSDARNKLGNIVYSRGRGGAYTCVKVTPFNPKSLLQQNQRAIHLANVRLWSTGLTNAQREAWNSFADNSTKTKSRIPGGRRSGANWFVCSNNKSVRWKGVQTLTPPPNLQVFEPGPIASITVNADTQSILIAVTHAPTASDTVELWATKPQSPGITRLYRGLVAFSKINAGDPSPKDVALDYSNTLGPFSTGDYIGFMLRGLNGTTYQEGYPWYQIVTAGGTADAMLQQTTILTDAQIKALPTTPIQLVATPGANKLLYAHSAIIKKKAAAGAYTNLSAPATTPFAVVQWGSGDTATGLIVDDNGVVPNTISMSQLLAADNVIITIPPPALTTQTNGLGTTAQFPTSAAAANTNLQIRAVNAAGNFTGGNAANTWEVTVFYSIVNV